MSYGSCSFSWQHRLILVDVMWQLEAAHYGQGTVSSVTLSHAPKSSASCSYETTATTVQICGCTYAVSAIASRSTAVNRQRGYSKASCAIACRGHTNQSASCAAVPPLLASLTGTVTLCTTQKLGAAKCDYDFASGDCMQASTARFT